MCLLTSGFFRYTSPFSIHLLILNYMFYITYCHYLYLNFTIFLLLLLLLLLPLSVPISLFHFTNYISHYITIYPNFLILMS